MFSNEQYIKGRFGLAIKIVLTKNKKKKLANEKKGIKSQFESSYEGISSSTGIRSATISDIVNGKSNLTGTTLTVLLESLGTTFTEFGKILDKITLDQIEIHMKKL